MKAVRLVEFGHLGGLKVVDVPEAVLGDRDVRIAVRAASLNFRDKVIVAGHYPGPLKPRPVPLSDGAGEVIAVGSAVSKFQVGDRVVAACFPHWIAGPMLEEYHAQSVGMTIDGMLAETATLHENAFVKIPDELTFADAASLPCAAPSAWSAMNVLEPLQAGQTVLVQGTGGVSLFALQLAKAQGARVLAITSTEEKARLLETHGVDGVVNYIANPDWHTAILDLTEGRGVDKVVEVAGETTIRKSVACTRIGGELGLVGFLSGFGGGVPPTDISGRSVILRGISIGPRMTLERVISVFSARKLKPVISHRFAFDDFRHAYTCLESGQHVGKVVIEMPA